MWSSYLFPFILLAVGSSLADFRLSCNPLTPACPGTVVLCECSEVDFSLTWNVSYEMTSCTIKYNDINQGTTTPEGDCNAVSDDVSISRRMPVFRFNSNLTINLMKNVTVSCANNRIQRNSTFDLASSPSAPVNLIISQNSTSTTNSTSITVKLDWSPPLINDGNTSYQVTVDNATEVMYSDDTMAFVMLNSSGQYLVNITALNCAGSSPALSGVINITDTELGLHLNSEGFTPTAGSSDSGENVNQTTPDGVVTTDRESTTYPTSQPAAFDTSLDLQDWLIAVIVVGGAIIIVVLPAIVCVIVVIVKCRSGKAGIYSTNTEQEQDYNTLSNSNLLNILPSHTNTPPAIDNDTPPAAAGLYSVIELQHMDNNQAGDEEIDPCYSTVSTTTARRTNNPQSTQNTEDNSPPPPMIYSQVVKPKGAQARPTTPPEVEYDNIMPPPAATPPARPPKPSATKTLNYSEVKLVQQSASSIPPPVDVPLIYSQVKATPLVTTTAEKQEYDDVLPPPAAPARPPKPKPTANAEYDTTSHVIKVKKEKEVPSGEYGKLEMTSPATQPPPLPSLYAEVRKVESKTESPPPPPVPEQKFDFSGGDNLK